MRVLAALSLLLPVGAFAQTRPDLEYRDTEVDEKEERLTVRGFFESSYYEYNNLDVRVLEEESGDQEILFSDDRGGFAFTGAQVELGYQVDDQVRVVVAGSHRGLWGDDQIGETNQFGGFIYFPALYADLYTKPSNKGVRFRIGRQFYSLAGLGPGVRDYVLADILDMVRVDIPVGSIGTWTLVPINVYSTASDYAEVDFVGLIGQQNPETYNFRGNVLTRRLGTTFDLAVPGTSVDAQAYAFFTNFHGRGSGADISNNGVAGNFTDNDYVVNYGVRGSLGTTIVPFAEFNGSVGIDRSQLGLRDIDTNGFAWGGGVVLDTRNDAGAGLIAQARYFESQGAAVARDGQQFSHGYVGMKGQQVGGTLFNRFLGFHPSAYAGRNGITDNPQQPSRKSGTRALEAFATYQLDMGLSLFAGVWHLQDTGFSNVDFSDLDNLEPDPSLSIAEIAATRRLGRTLGTELNLEVGWTFSPRVDAFARGAAVLPGQHYSIVVDRVGGNALGSPEPRNPWAAEAGVRVSF